MNKQSVKRGTVQASMRDDWPPSHDTKGQPIPVDAYSFERWTGSTWEPLWPEYPTFDSKRAADEYGVSRFEDYRK